MKKHIMLINDDEGKLRIFLGLLGRINISYKCTWARTGAQAIKQLQFLKPDIIFLDLNISGAGDPSCLVAIRELSHLRDVPVILHSALTPECIEKGLKADESAWMVKPDGVADITAILAQYDLV
jgi:CheY-like chemotaxis protein